MMGKAHQGRGPHRRDSSGQTLAALGAAALQHQSTRPRGHPLAEAMLVSALRVAGLKCPLHGRTPIKTSRLFQAQKVNDVMVYCQDFPGVILNPRIVVGARRPSPPGSPPIRAISMIRVNKRLRFNSKIGVKICLLHPKAHDRFPTIGDKSNLGFKDLSTTH